MTKDSRLNVRAAALAGLLPILFLTGCASSPASRLYVFAPDETWRTAATQDAACADCTVRMAPVELAAYLDRPQIVTRVAGNQIQTNPFHRWGIPLGTTVAELIGASLERALPDVYVDLVPTRSRRDVGYLIEVQVIRLDGYPGGALELIAQWRLSRTGSDSTSGVQRRSHYRQDTGGKTFAHYVEAIRLAVNALGTDIADAIRTDRQPSAPAGP